MPWRLKHTQSLISKFNVLVEVNRLLLNTHMVNSSPNKINIYEIIGAITANLNLKTRE